MRRDCWCPIVKAVGRARPRNEVTSEELFDSFRGGAPSDDAGRRPKGAPAQRTARTAAISHESADQAVERFEVLRAFTSRAGPIPT